MSKPRLIFAGTPDFALASLKALVEAGRVPVAVLTQPDRPAGRGRRLTASPVKRFAEARRIPVLQPETLRDPSVIADIAALRPDLIVVAAYGLLLPRAVLDLPRSGCVNVHASLLPRWRGAAPVQAAILAGDDRTGVSLMQMEPGLDSGPVFARSDIAVGDTDSAGELQDSLARLGATLLVERIDEILDGRLEAVPQDEAQVTYAGKIRKEDARLDWSASAIDLARRVRAYNPAPGAFFEFGGERIKCWRAVASADAAASPGKVLAAGPRGIEVACGDGRLVLTELQRPGRKSVSAAEFASQLPLAGRRFH